VAAPFEDIMGRQDRADFTLVTLGHQPFDQGDAIVGHESLALL
jgi:hypothetical protein